MQNIHKKGTSALTLTPSPSVQLYWMSWVRSLTPREREMVLYKRPLGSGNSFRRFGLTLSKRNNKKDTHRKVNDNLLPVETQLH